jgi:MOSC domain-containing protein YiiM
MKGRVVAVAASPSHSFSKTCQSSIVLEKGVGVRGDCHSGATVQHLSRITSGPANRNLRQVHLIHAELFDELSGEGFVVEPADLGENITTAGIDVLRLPRHTVLKLGLEAEVEVTGLRNPCAQINKFKQGLLYKVAVKRPDGSLERKTGIMAIVRKGGAVSVNDEIVVALPEEPYLPLEPV